jgi:alpha-L-arabinofuranosidase
MMPQILQSSGITTLRYPGGAYADNYHWSTYKPTKWQGTDQLGYYAAQNDFGHFVRLADQVGTAVITVNYGSNLDATGGGTPEEAAAWVAYAMGDPANTKPIGKDSTGHDWQTIGFWAGLRASQPLASDDGLNFLRIGHPNPVLIKYWEVGNEVYRKAITEDRARKKICMRLIPKIQRTMRSSGTGTPVCRRTHMEITCSNTSRP